MSGICGIYSPSHPDLASREILNKMLDAIGHRGKAARRSFVDEKVGIAIGHVFAPAFLAAGEEAVPNWHEDEGYIATLDGAIFNANEFLSAHSCLRPSDRDTGGAVEYLRQNPTNFPEKLDGHYSLAVWDKPARELWLVRDPLGVKPLYYCHFEDQGLLIFASELKGVLPHPIINRRLSREALTAYLTFGYVPAPLSIFEGIHKVFPGEASKFGANGQMIGRRHWYKMVFDSSAGEFEALAVQLRAHVIQTIAKHIEGAEHLGVLLSGGLDSTILLGVLKMLGIPKLETFTIGFHTHAQRAQLAEDLQWAEQVAQRFSTQHHPIIIAPDHDPHFLLPRIFRQLDEPMLTPNAYSKYFLLEAAQRNGINSCLSGSNGEYLFERDPQAEIQKDLEALGNDATAEDLVLSDLTKLFAFAEQKELLAEPIDEPRETMLRLIRHYQEGIEAEDLGDWIYGVPVRIKGAQKSIAAQDVAAVLNGVEIRHPFFDQHLLACTNRIPARFKGSESKSLERAIIKAAFRDILPEAILGRKKIGYPSYYWNHGEIEDLKQSLLSPAGLARTGLFQPRAVQKIIEADEKSNKKSAGKRTWGLLVLQAWFELYLNGNDDFLRAPSLA
ncbi:MAG: asparagine synthase-related protein [candidate division KSB1 bacterium]|nr:asparagine synthase-related protein [candidate division KSB1 bacterium]MDZ7302426.1 asparagine synthase-related protein [candidate division KSB1 bacterium]MDZ7311628.1 asparagine synthase-related protein [candidate division KSB1 bacterium]